MSVTADMWLRFNDLVTTHDRLTAPRTPQLASFAQEVADPSRAAMLLALMDGRAWTVGELAHQAGVARNTASEHVRRLVRAGMVDETRQGRHCYVTLAGSDVAEALEAMCLVTGTRPAARSLHGRRHDQELVAGRTCYRHLAGRLGVSLLDGMLDEGFLTARWDLTEAGRSWFVGLGVDTSPDPRRDLLRPCLDWTQRRPHAAGALADRLATKAFERGWVVRGSHRRSARLTPAGERALATALAHTSVAEEPVREG